jgi:hypothetical protein
LIPNILLKAIVDVYTQNKIMIKFYNELSKLVEINKGVRQGCPLSPTPFNIYLDEIIAKMAKTRLNRNKTFQKPVSVNAVICG